MQAAALSLPPPAAHYSPMARPPTPRQKLDGLEGAEPCRCFVGRDPEHWCCTLPGRPQVNTRKRDRFEAEKWIRKLLGLKDGETFPRGTRWDQSGWPHCPHAGTDHDYPIETWARICLREEGEEYADRPLAMPTQIDPAFPELAALPGTNKKILTMQTRVEEGFRPTHPDDIRLEDVSEKVHFRPINSEEEHAPERNGRIPYREHGFGSVARKDDTMIQWVIKIPGGRILEGIRAHSKSEAKGVAKRILELRKKQSLPAGTIVERAERITKDLVVPDKKIPQKKRDQAYRIAMRCSEYEIPAPRWVQAILAQK